MEEQLSKSRTKYRNLHHPPSPTIKSPIKNKILSNENSDDDDDDDDSTLPTFINQIFSPPKTSITNKSPSSPPPPLSLPTTTTTNNDTGMFRAIRGQVIIHHDHDRSSKVQCEEDKDDDDDNDDEIENLHINRTNGGNYELHYDVDNPLEISCSMSLSSAETVSDHSPSPVRHISSININGNNEHLKQDRTPIDLSSDDETPSSSSILSDNDHHEKKVIDHDNIKDQDEKLRTFRGWHLSMLKQIDEKLREIELETITTTPTPTSATPVPTSTTINLNTNKNLNTITPNNQNKKSLVNKKKLLRPTIRRRFETTNVKRHYSPIPQIKTNIYRSSSPTIEKESRTLIINLPPSSSSSSSSSDNEENFPPPPIPTPSEPIHIRIVKSPIYQLNQRSQSTERLILRDQGAQTEPLNPSNNFFDYRSLRPASVECDRIQPTRSLTRTQGNQFLRQQQQQQQPQTNQNSIEPIKFYSLRSRNIQSRPSIVTQSPMPIPRLPPIPLIIPNRLISNEKPISRSPPQPQPPPPPPSTNITQPTKSADPSVYSDDYGHVTQMDTTNLGSLVDKVFDDIYQDKASDFYRDYKQLLNDIQIRFSMISPVEQPPIHHQPPPPPPPPPPIQRPPPPPSKPVFVDYSQLSQTSSSQAHLLDTLIYIPNPL